MAFAPAFTSSQSAGAITIATLTDTSTGYTGITGRLVTLRKYDGNYLVPVGTVGNSIAWPFVVGTGDVLNIDCLDKDYCLSITVSYYSGSTISTSLTALTLFTGYGNLFLRQLTQALAARKIQIDAENFWVNKNKLRVLLDDAAQAVSLLNDQTIAQFCLDESKLLTDTIATFF